MAPDIDLQLQVVIRALEDVIQPAVNPANPAAQEQVRLSLAILRHVKNRHAAASVVTMRELDNAIRLGEAVQANANDALLHEALRAAEMPTSRTNDAAARRAVGAIQTAVAEIVRRTAFSADGRPIALAVITASTDQFDLVRSWFRASGHEPDPGALPALETLLRSTDQ